MKETQEPSFEDNVIFVGALAVTATVMGVAWVLRHVWSFVRRGARLVTGAGRESK